MSNEFKISDLIETSEKITALENVRYSIKKALHKTQIEITEATEANELIKAAVTHEVFNNDVEKKYKNADQRKAAVKAALEDSEIYCDRANGISKGELTIKELELDARLNLIKLNTNKRLYEIMKLSMQK